ncbi:N-methyl-L-tryptophan oxidase [Pseudoclavibacter sp. CFCC 13611]|uniref:N-methyl-L-tryptophan oxidase n=1 Tax=Pseudoclavibacter sp. CFCC 13611 TaxID=2615178 RepID=UPI0013011C62|nr:N-methyl-L-tryptophan oxidase [Pseudoclavibacter sp. CFCC 13611]KAB1663902.1 N-methyl-L-tryptophan oxidase [Pseudoclavibacter sp. CFCC 13611]
MSVTKADVVVVGLGTVGSMAAWRLAERGRQVIGLEQFPLMHPFGGFTGESRLFRTAYHEGSMYVPLLLRARELWVELEQLSHRDLLLKVGTLSVGQQGAASISNVIESVRRHDLPHTTFDAEHLRAAYPQMRVHDDEIGVLDYLGGGLRPEAAVFSALEQARSLGAQLCGNTPVRSIEERGDGVLVQTDDDTYLAEQVIVAGGAWGQKLDPRLTDLVKIYPLILTWFMPQRIQDFAPGAFPTFIRDRDGVHFFGAPALEGYSVKVSPDRSLPPVESVTSMPRTLDSAVLEKLGREAAAFFPSLHPEPVHYSVHPDAFTETKVPIIDRSGSGRVVTFAGLSGHGFKFAPVYGELAAQLTEDDAPALYDERFSVAGH